jgi:hypothetical protein
LEKKNILSLDVIRPETMNLNEMLRLEKKRCLFILNDIQRNKDDHMSLEDQIDEIKYRYQKVNNFLIESSIGKECSVQRPT